MFVIRNAIYQVRSQIDVTVGGNDPEDSFRCAVSTYKVRTIACESWHDFIAILHIRPLREKEISYFFAGRYRSEVQFIM
jgi:hypothetical protein